MPKKSTGRTQNILSLKTMICMRGWMKQKRLLRAIHSGEDGCDHRLWADGEQIYTLKQRKKPCG